MSVSIAFFWPGIIVFLVLLGIFLTGLRYYGNLKHPRSMSFWIVGIIICVLVAYAIAIFVVTPLFH